MQPTVRVTTIIINPSAPGEPANVAHGVPQPLVSGTTSPPVPTHTAGAAARPGPVTGAASPAAPHAAARAALQAQLPPVPGQDGNSRELNQDRLFVIGASLVTTGGLTATVGVGLVAHTLANSIVSPDRYATEVVGRMAAVVGTGMIGLAGLASGVTLLKSAAAARQAHAVSQPVAAGQVQLPRIPRARRRVPVELNEVVIVPNVFPASVPRALESASEPASAQWDAVAAAAQLPFPDGHG